jgi:hypothetical protein
MEKYIISKFRNEFIFWKKKKINLSMWKLTLNYGINCKWYYILKGNYMDFQSLILTARKMWVSNHWGPTHLCLYEFDFDIVWCAQFTALGCCHNFLGVSVTWVQKWLGIVRTLYLAYNKEIISKFWGTMF